MIITSLLIFTVFWTRAISSEKLSAMTGKVADFDCSFDLDPSAEVDVQWDFNGSNLPNKIDGEKYRITVSRSAEGAASSELTVFNVDWSDAGTYRCFATENGAPSGINTQEFNLEVSAAPNVIDVQDGKGRIETSATLSCSYSGKPLPEIKWLRAEGGKVIPEDSERYEISYEQHSETEVESHLKILELNRRDNGTYLCHGENEHGSDVAIMNVIVLDKPDATIDYATAVGTESIFLNWTIVDWNSPITDILLKYRREGSAAWVYFIDEKIPTDANSFVVHNLTFNSSYLFKLSVKSEVGSSEFHQYHLPVATLDFDPTFSPEVSVKGLTWNFISISWTTPEDVRKKELIHYYKLTRFTMDTEVNMYQPSSRPASYLWRHLNPNTEYSFTVSACSSLTRECGKPSDIVKATTEDGLSGPPQKVEIQCRHDNVSGMSFVDVRWKEPAEKFGQIEFYNIKLSGKAEFMDGSGRLSVEKWGPEMKTEDSSMMRTRFDFLPANTNYTARICAVTRRKQCGQDTAVTCRMKETPPRPEYMTRFRWYTDAKNGRDVIRLQIPKLSERNGLVCCIRVIVVKLRLGQTAAELPHSSELKISTYKNVHSTNGWGGYIAEILGSNFMGQDVLIGDGQNILSTDLGTCPTCQTGIRAHLLREASKSEQRLLEDQRLRRFTKRFSKPPPSMQDSGELVEDGFLFPDYNYTAFVEVIVSGDVIGRSPYMTPRRPGETLYVSSSSPVNAVLVSVLGVLSGLVFVAVFLLVALFLLKRYSKQVAATQGGVEMDLRRSFRHFCSTWRGRDHSQYLITPEASPPEIKPILKDDLVAAFQERHKDSDYGFQSEFELLPDRFPDRTTLNCELPVNRIKNRYPDIKSYDQTRVKLTPVEGVEGTDYINANFVVGYKERKRWVCAQGPLEHTIIDFWKMIWEQGVELIIMLTNLEEYNRIKCAQYWPGAGDSTYGNITVRFCIEKRYSDYIVRELSVIFKKDVTESETRTVYQYHYLQWKDFNAPEHAPGMLKFVKRINESWSGVSPMCVHCSAGVGRSGTLIAIDSLIEQLRDEGSVGIFQMVSDLRHQRNYLVQSVKQYMFVYRAIMEMAQFGDTEINASSVKAKLSESDDKLEEEFTRLSKVVDDRKALSVGSNDENKYKNQSEFVIPFDRNRVILTPDGLRPHSTYINASFIEGYHNDESFIITQDPLPGTMEDFWRMITEHNITTMVMLSGDDTSILYWDDQINVSKTFGTQKATLLTKEKLPSFIRREFTIYNSKVEEEHKLTHFEYNGWSGGEKSVPTTTHDLLDLAEQAMAYKVEAKLSGPIAVHCKSGSNRSSVFVALCCLIQQIKTESRADIFTVVRKLRSQRQGMVQHLVQYKFIYRAVSDYIDLYRNKDEECEYSIPINAIGHQQNGTITHKDTSQ